ncbi:tetratricopeptide repeat protein [Gillisia sp. Hel1_33_143]|uniref:tetratricopeptide repeat protein n=1 Tax=Gillisia sp. Hel1_33_143 TaxID=1336796 RepID=UPI001E5378C7|nr:tetratricopeptide repeat protein [Gillisia sp. Hel1_33_143]
MAKNYMDQGEYEKALKTYEQLVKNDPRNQLYFFGLINSYQQLEDFTVAEKLLQEKLSASNDPIYLIELGHNLELQKLNEKANSYYEKALVTIAQNVNYSYSLARSFEKYSLLDYAEKAYKNGMAGNSMMRFEIPLARIYGEQGKLDQMFEAFLALIEKEPELSTTIIREFDRYITNDASNEANLILKKAILKRLQQNQGIVFTEILSWLFIQQKDFNKAFVQEKAIYKRGNKNLQRIIQLAVISRSEEDLETSKEVLEFIIGEDPPGNILLQAKQLLLNMKVQTASKNEYEEIAKDFDLVLEEFGNGEETLSIQIDRANFIAFQLENVKKAEDLLLELAARTNSNYQLASVKMALADILVIAQKFNQALINYSQVQNLVKNDELAQEARYKVAKTSYYKGDFEWAKSQLDVLKASSTQLIANNALELSLLIQENSLEDSTQTALKLYAHADLLIFQNKKEAAIKILEELLQQHKGDKIEDEALLKQAALYVELQQYEKAETNYLKILEYYPDDILGDNATYLLADLYNGPLGKPEKAKDFYEQIIFNYADSIYFVDARNKYRSLRGDLPD